MGFDTEIKIILVYVLFISLFTLLLIEAAKDGYASNLLDIPTGTYNLTGENITIRGETDNVLIPPKCEPILNDQVISAIACAGITIQWIYGLGDVTSGSIFFTILIIFPIIIVGAIIVMRIIRGN